MEQDIHLMVNMELAMVVQVVEEMEHFRILHMHKMEQLIEVEAAVVEVDI